MFNLLRKLACSIEWQILYARCKDCNGIKLFDNDKDFSALQLSFLSFLEMYNNVYLDIATGEELMDDKRIQDPMLVDAYLVYKKEEKKNKDKKETSQNNTGIPTLICRRRRQ